MQHVLFFVDCTGTHCNSVNFAIEIHVTYCPCVFDAEKEKCTRLHVVCTGPWGSFTPMGAHLGAKSVRCALLNYNVAQLNVLRKNAKCLFFFYLLYLFFYLI